MQQWRMSRVRPIRSGNDRLKERRREVQRARARRERGGGRREGGRKGGRESATTSHVPRRHEVNLVELHNPALFFFTHRRTVAHPRKELLRGGELTLLIVVCCLRGRHQEAHLNKLIVVGCRIVRIKLHRDLVFVLRHLGHLVER